MKLQFAFAPLFVTSLVVACGGSSTNPAGATDSGASTPTDGSTVTPGDSSTVADSAPAVNAPATGPACTTSKDCNGALTDCCIASAAGGTCVATGTCAGAVVGCEDSSACTGGDVCCVNIASKSAACASPGCAYQLCSSNGECTGGETCQPLVIDGYTLPVETCAQPPVDAGPGTDSGDDSGIADASDSG